MRATRARAALVVGVVAGLLASGCATIPTSGPPQSTPAPPPAEGNGTNCCGLVVRGWQPGLHPAQVVSNFLLASASFAHDHAIARGYLAPAASKLWRPGSAVTILKQTPKFVPMQGVVGADSNHVEHVLVTGQEVAYLGASGQYIPVNPGGAADQIFTLGSVRGRLLITALPSGRGHVSHELLLTSRLFHLVYKSYNLYFHAMRGGVLVPDPVFVPADSASPETTLIDDLRHDPKGLLRGAAVTAFPHGAYTVKVQTVPGLAGKTAIIDIHLPAGTPRSDIEPMAAQLVWTLTSPAYNPPLVRAVELKINGQLWSPPGASGSVLTTSDLPERVPSAYGSGTVYLVTTNGTVRVLTRQASHSSAVPGEAGTGRVPIGKVAISPDQKYLAGVAGPGTTLYTANLSAAAKHAGSPAGEVHAQLTGSSLSKPSWDSSDDLWVAGRVHGSWGVWVLPQGQGPAREVNLPLDVTGPVTGLRVAPDGVRIAMIVGKGSSAQLRLGSIVRDGNGFSIKGTVPLGPHLSGVTAVTWYDRDRLLAITRGKPGGQLWNVPVNGDAPTRVAGPADMTSITADGPDRPLYLVVSSGRLEKSLGLGEPWTDSGTGIDAVYPG